MKLFFAASLAHAIHPSYYFASASPHDIKPTPKTHDNDNHILNKEQSKHHNRNLKQSCATRVNNTPKKLLQCVTVESVRKHQSAFQDIANANNGTRASGTSGYDASTDYVVEQLEVAGYDVVTQQFPFTYWQVLGPSTLTQISPNNVTYVEDANYTLMAYSSEADVSGAVTLVNNFGCDTSDFDGEKIALINRGNCSFALKAENAAAAGAVGVVIVNRDDTLTVVSLRQDYAGGIPVFFVPFSLGDYWAATPDLVLHMNADTITSRTFSTMCWLKLVKEEMTKLLWLGLILTLSQMDQVFKVNLFATFVIPCFHLSGHMLSFHTFTNSVPTPLPSCLRYTLI